MCEGGAFIKALSIISSERNQYCLKSDIEFSILEFLLKVGTGIA